MADKILIDEVYEALKTEGELFGKVADALKISPFSMPDLIRKKSTRLTEYASLEIISKWLGKHIDEILVEEKVTA